MRDEAVEPRAWSLTEAVEGAGEQANVIRPCWISDAGGLLAVDLFPQVTVQERIGNVELVSQPALAGDDGEDGLDGGRLDDR